MRVIYTGSFDPVTLGHIDIINRAAQLFDEVVVAVLINPDKEYLLSNDDRYRLVKAACSELLNVNVVSFAGLTVDCVKLYNVDAIIRGIRQDGELFAEMNMARINNQLSGIETIFLPASPLYAHISSSMVREVFRLSGDITSFVPKNVFEKLILLKKVGG